MNGNKYLLDTNTIVSLLNGNSNILHLMNTASWVGISIINVLEFLAFQGLTQFDKALFLDFIKTIEVINLSSDNQSLIDEICNIRAQYKLKLPDAIIAATALVSHSSLITNDGDFKKIQPLSVVVF